MNKAERRTLDLHVPAREYVTKRLITVEIQSSIQEAAQKMVEFGISSLAVSEKEKVVGFLTDTDLKERVVARGLSPSIQVKDVMTHSLITADIDEPVENIIQIMAKNNIKHVLITEKEAIIGLITLRDLEDIERQMLEAYISRE